MGMGARNIEARLAASVGQLEEPVAPEFQAAQDVPKGGVLFALPALLVTGLLKSSENFFKFSKGYYGLDNLLLVLAFTALARVKSIESLRYSAPGEWGLCRARHKPHTVSTWFSKWNTFGICGLVDSSGRGRPLLLNDQQKSDEVKRVEKSPRPLKSVLSDLEAELGITVSLDTLKLILINGVSIV